MTTVFLGKYILTGILTCHTGLHIGGSTTSLEIGGIDNPVIKDPLTDEPVIPGSSLKGKLRSLAEWHLGLIEKHQKHNTYQAYACEEIKNDPPDKDSPAFEKWQNALQLARLFGPASDDYKVRMKAGPTRLTIRDAFLTEESRESLRMILGPGSFTEIKTENAIDRVTSEATPRPVERVPARSEFTLSIILDAYDDDDPELYRVLFTTMSLLEHSSLGGGGSRGSGQVSFRELKLCWRSSDDFKAGKPGVEISLPGSTIDSILQNFNTINWPTP